jgi:hypothetical protein
VVSAFLRPPQRSGAFRAQTVLGHEYPAAAEVRISTMWYLWLALILMSLFAVASPAVTAATTGPTTPAVDGTPMTPISR